MRAWSADFHDHPAYIAALGENVRRYWGKHGRGPTLLMSFHGLPKKGAELLREAMPRAPRALLAKNAGAERARMDAGHFQSRFG